MLLLCAGPTMPEQSIIVWDLESIPDLSAAARMLDLGGATETEVREALGEASPSILCTRSSALVPWLRAANRRAGEWMLWEHPISANAAKPS